MEKQTTDKGAVFYENETWNFIAKVININNYTIEYVKKSGFSSFGEAQQAYIDSKEQYKSQIIRVKKLTNMKYTFLEYLDIWYQKIYLPNAKSSVAIGYGWTIYHIIIPNATKDVLIGMVSSVYLNDLLSNCVGYCNSAGAMAYKVLNVALKDALDDGYIKTNPLTDMTKYYWNPPKLVIYSKEQIKTLLQAAYDYHSIYLEVLLAIFAGLRKGEIMGLTYDDFNEEEHTVRVQRQVTRDYEVVVKKDLSYKVLSSEQSVKPPKSFNSYRTLRIHDCIFEQLKIRKHENEELLKKLPADAQKWKNYVCIGPKGKIKSDGTCNSALERICARCSIPRITMHDLRHMFATILIEQKMPLENISKLMGHKSITTTFEIYCGIIEAKDCISKLIDTSFDPINAVNASSKGGNLL